jgi:hypothetical protein
MRRGVGPRSAAGPRDRTGECPGARTWCRGGAGTRTSCTWLGAGSHGARWGFGSPPPPVKSPSSVSPIDSKPRRATGRTASCGSSSRASPAPPGSLPSWRALRRPLRSLVNDGGAATLVRQELYRRPVMLRDKRLVVWEFVERDIRFGTEGWQLVPLPSAGVQRLPSGATPVGPSSSRYHDHTHIR